MKLGQNAQMVLEEVAVQCQRGDEYLRALRAKIETTRTKHGMIGLPSEPEATHTEHGIVSLFDGSKKPGQSDSLEGIYEDLLLLLAGRDYDRQELPSLHAAEIRVKVTRTSGEGVSKDGGLLEDDAFTGADFLFRRKPAQLMQVQFYAPITTGFIRFFIERFDMEVQFGYILEVPLPVKVRTRVRSRGIGRLLIDQETVTVIAYEAAHNTGPQPDGIAGAAPRG